MPGEVPKYQLKRPEPLNAQNHVILKEGEHVEVDVECLHSDEHNLGQHLAQGRDEVTNIDIYRWDCAWVEMDVHPLLHADIDEVVGRVGVEQGDSHGITDEDIDLHGREA